MIQVEWQSQFGQTVKPVFKTTQSDGPLIPPKKDVEAKANVTRSSDGTIDRSAIRQCTAPGLEKKFAGQRAERDSLERGGLAIGAQFSVDPIIRW
jgi:hypothetical protein